MSDKTYSGKIVTFYSFKGGTGRSMALANVAWILAANNYKVLMIDWDLDAPGLHYYFRPFLNDKYLEETSGLTELMEDWLEFVLTPEDDRPPIIKDNPRMLADAQRFVEPLEKLPFTEFKGCLHFLGAGKQDESYANRIRTFDWNAFYARRGGGSFLNAFREQLKEQYDFVLIDSRTGIADIAGICTIQMPDSVVLCFTYNRQSIRGIAAVAQSIFDQRPEVELLPVPMRIIRGQQKQLEEAKRFAREKLNRFLPKNWIEKQIDDYWINSKVSQDPDYAWHETLAVLSHPPTERDTMLSDMQWLAGQIAGSDKPLLTRELESSQCKEYLAEFELHASWEEIGTLYEVPSLPLNYLPRSDVLDSLKEAVLGSSNQPVGVYGTSGIGKSVLVAAFARQEKVRRTFPDGIYWLTLGQESDEITKQSELVQMLGQQPAFGDYRQGCEKLIELTRGRVCLVILDDVWTEKQVRAFTELGQRCRLLVTTNNQEVLKGIGAQEVPLDALKPAQALMLLVNSATGQSVDPLSSEAGAVADKCERIPLALTVLGALVQKSGYSWQDVLNRLSDVDPQRLRDRLPAYELPDSLLAALQVSIENLPEKMKKAFLDCAILPENAFIPEAALQKLWSDYLAEGEAAGVAQWLAESSLLSCDEKHYRLHDLYHYFLRTSVENLSALHRRLLDAYLRDCHYGDWSSGPNDGYFFQHLPYHLFQAHDKPDDLRILLLNYNWIAAKLKATSIQAVIADYTDYEAVRGEDESIHLVQRALRLSADRLSQDIAQLSPLLFGRLRDMNRRDIIEQLKENCKLKVAVNLAISAEEITCYGHTAGVHAIAVTPNGQWVISACWDGSLKRWNLKESIAKGTGISDKTFHGHAGPVRAVTVTPDNKYIISGSDDHTLRVWKPDTSELMYALGGHEGPIRAVAVTPDGRWIVSGSRDYTVKVWNLAGDRRPTTFDQLHDHTIYAVKVLPDGQRVISASGDCTLKLWNLSTGDILNKLIGHQGRVLTVAVLPDGWRAVSGSGWKDPEKSSKDFTLRLWDLDTGTVMRILEGHTDEVFAVAVLPDGRRAVSGACDCTIRLWDLDTGESSILGRHDQGVNAVTVTPDGRYAVSGSNDTTLKIWKLES